MRESLISYGRQHVDPEDEQAVLAVLRSDRLTTGAAVQVFEDAFAEYVGATYAVSFSSGTAALHGAMSAAGLAGGDEGITSPLTFCATSNVLLFQGALPVFADIDPMRLTLDPEKAEAAISERTRVVVPVDFAGQPADHVTIRRMADSHGLFVIDDASHALGGRIAEHAIGSLADMTTFSFHPVKHITTGEGGMVTTNDATLAERLRRFRSHGIDPDPVAAEEQGAWYYEMIDLGLNYRMTDISCALGSSQLKKAAAWLERRRAIAATYSESLAAIPGIELPSEVEGTRHAWHLYAIRVKQDDIQGGRRAVFDALQAENIGVQVHYIPVHLHPYYVRRLGNQRGRYPIAEQAYEELLTLPLFPSMTDSDVDDVVRALHKVVHGLLRG